MNKFSNEIVFAVKTRIFPTEEQEKRLFQMSGIARYAYNWAIEYQLQRNIFIHHFSLKKEWTKKKKAERKERPYLYEVDCDVMKTAVIDASISMKRYIDGISGKPTYRNKRTTEPTFSIDAYALQFSEDKHSVLIRKLIKSKKAKQPEPIENYMRMSEYWRIPSRSEDVNHKLSYGNPRFTYDNVSNYWFFSLSIIISFNDITQLPQHIKDFIHYNGDKMKTESIGIDLGIKVFAYLSDGTFYKNINKESVLLKLRKRERRLQRKLARSDRLNNPQCYDEKGALKTGSKFVHTKSYIKTRNQLKKVQKRIANILHDYRMKVASEIINRNPKSITMEDLSVSNMMKNRCLAKVISYQGWYEFRVIMTYKCQLAGIPLIFANRFYASSKTCSECGHKMETLGLNERTYVCPECGLVLDRDLNAAINLKNYGEQQLNVA